MTSKTFIEDLPKENIIDDLEDKKEKNKMSDIDNDKLAELRKKLAKKEEDEMPAKVVVKSEKSINFGVIGSGQAGGRLAETFYRLGYDAVAVNTATQDLKFLNLPETNKLLLEFGLGGAARELDLGKAAAEAHKDKIMELVNNQLADAQVLVFCLSLGGGSGAGSCETIVDLLTSTGKPLMVMTVLPMESEDAQTKHNALETLSKLTKFAQTKRIANLVVVDNAKIESLFSDVGQMDFYNVANRAIVEPLDVFNKLSSMPSNVKPLDPTELAKILIDGEGLTTYGEIKVSNYSDETAIAEAVVENLNSNLLASGFDLKQAKYVGVLLTANKEVWKKIPSVAVNYATAMISDHCGTPKGIFKGVYTTEDTEDCVKVYSMFSGLGLPMSRVEQLKKEAQTLTQTVKTKDEQRNLTLNLDSGKDETVSKVQEIKNKIAAKSSTFGKFTTGVVDRRKG